MLIGKSRKINFNFILGKQVPITIINNMLLIIRTLILRKNFA